MINYGNNTYKATVLKWVDGDTVDLRVDLGMKTENVSRFRLLGINAPEVTLKKGVTKAEKAKGLALKERLINDYPAGTSVAIQTSKAGKYGRYLVTIFVQMDGKWTNLNNWLVEQGLAVPYMV